MDGDVRDGEPQRKATNVRLGDEISSGQEEKGERGKETEHGMRGGKEAKRALGGKKGAENYHFRRGVPIALKRHNPPSEGKRKRCFAPT